MAINKDYVRPAIYLVSWDMNQQRSTLSQEDQKGEAEAADVIDIITAHAKEKTTIVKIKSSRSKEPSSQC